MRSHRLSARDQLLVLFGSAMLAVASVAWAASDRTMVELFTTADRDPGDLSPMASAAGVEVRIYRVDAIWQLEADLSRNLPANARAAEREVLRRLQLLGAARQKDIRASAEALLRARELGIDRYPAVVIDGKVVAYGTMDVAGALAAYRQYGAQTP